MTAKEIFFALSIHLIFPLAGFLLFLQLRNRMRFENIPNAPIADLFIIFTSYGGLMLVVLTTLFWQWSGLASLGCLYLILVAPCVMGYIAYRHKQTKNLSKYHYWTFMSGVLYVMIAPITFGVMYFFSIN